MTRTLILAVALTTLYQCPWDTEPDPDDVAAVAVPPLGVANDGYFATSQECQDCHSNLPSSQAMRDSAGRPISMYDLWSGSMMANSARDPLWRAVVSAESAATPSLKAAIEQKCMRCHAPMASEDVKFSGEGPVSLALLTSQTHLGNLALDGVSCAACHQIDGENLGSPESFSGGFEVRNPGISIGPHEDPYAQGMLGTSGFNPVYVDYSQDSDLCATCHSLTTDTLTAAGGATGEQLHEQSAYLEWLNSSYSVGDDAVTCQGCHMPIYSEDDDLIVTPIARGRNGQDITVIDPRSPYGRHLFVGGNTLLPAIFRDNQETLNPIAGPDAFATTAEATRRHLATETGGIKVARVERDSDNLEVSVEVNSITGHKLPTGIPLRRAWIYLEVVDANSEVVFQSGRYDREGQILGADGSPLPFEAAGGPIEPHHDVIRSASEVQIYEAVMAGTDGQPTFTLLRGADFYKDNRILPDGWSNAFERVADIAPRGVDGDLNFRGGADDVTYVVDVGRREGPFTVSAQLLFMPLSQRFANELFKVNTPEIRAFKAMWSNVPHSPEVIATDAVSAQ